MKKLTLILASTLFLTTSCSTPPRGYREVSIKEDGLSDYLLINRILGQKYLPLESSSIQENHYTPD